MSVKVWMLSQFYVDDSLEIHPRSQMHPVAHDYADEDHTPVRPIDEDGWALVKVTTDHERIALAKQDSRIVYVGTPWNAPPAKMLEVYADKLGSDTYSMVGQVLLKLAETEPLYLPQ
ncbi:MAG: hypothetical protein LAO78_23795 [Acidobacteriia bacterium]|nr:hypothetical protein [Terriglobia bacterium]